MLRRGTVCLAFLVATAMLMAGCQPSEEAAAIDFPVSPLIDPNTATEAELSTIAGLDAAAVGAIVAGRPFATPTALHAAINPGVGEDELRSVYLLMFVKVGLNTGAEEDFKLIPSTMSARKLAHEFDEYRPYDSIDQFRREMAKYVSDAEVDHLTRYVTLD